jgi:hypothetical protein
VTRSNRSGMLLPTVMKRSIADNHKNELFNMKNMTRVCSTNLRIMINRVIKNLRVLATIELPMDALLEMFVVKMVANRLDNETRKAYELQLKPQVYPIGQSYLFF